jgi:hypothetical protein
MTAVMLSLNAVAQVQQQQVVHVCVQSVVLAIANNTRASVSIMPLLTASLQTARASCLHFSIQHSSRYYYVSVMVSNSAW